MLLSACCCVYGRCRHLCIPCFVVAVVLTPSVVVSSTTDLPRLPLPWLLTTIGPSGELSDNDVNNDPAGEPCHPTGRASQTSTAPSRLCRARRPYLSPSLSSSSVLSSRNAPLKVGVARPQKIARVLFRFRIGVVVVVVLRCDAVAVVALPILPPNESRRHRLRASTSSRSPYSPPPSPRRPPSSRRSSRGGSRLQPG